MGEGQDPQYDGAVDEAPHGRRCGSQKPVWILGTVAGSVQSPPKIGCSLFVLYLPYETGDWKPGGTENFLEGNCPWRRRLGVLRRGQISSQWEEGLSAVCMALPAERCLRTHTGLQHLSVGFLLHPHLGISEEVKT